jgi:hypothetical protein
MRFAFLVLLMAVCADHLFFRQNIGSRQPEGPQSWDCVQIPPTPGIPGPQRNPYDTLPARCEYHHLQKCPGLTGTLTLPCQAKARSFFTFGVTARKTWRGHSVGTDDLVGAKSTRVSNLTTCSEQFQTAMAALAMYRVFNGQISHPC